MLGARDPDRRMPALDLGPRAGENAGLAAEEVDGVAALGGVREEHLHQVGPVHAPWDRVAQRARGPDDRHAVGRDDVAELDRLAQLAVGLHAHELGRVQGGVEGRASRRDGFVHQLDRIVQGDRVERGSEQMDALRHSPSPSLRARRSPRRAWPRCARLRAHPKLRDLPGTPLAVQRCPRRLEDRSRFVPTTTFVPASTVTGLSVDSRSVTHGMPSTVASSWTPPESVSTTLASARRPRKSR